MFDPVQEKCALPWLNESNVFVWYFESSFIANNMLELDRPVLDMILGGDRSCEGFLIIVVGTVDASGAQSARRMQPRCVNTIWPHGQTPLSNALVNV